MTTGATDTFDEACDDIIADALTNVGALGPGKTPTGRPRAHAFRALNRLVKSIDGSGNFLWRTVRRSIAITAGVASYGPSIVGADVIAIQDPTSYLPTGQTSRIQVWGQTVADYQKIADRTSQGTPLNFLPEKTLAGFTVTLWPVPDTSGSLEMWVALRAKDYVIGSDTSDFPTKWIDCLVSGLSWKLAPAYGQDGSTFRDEFLAAKTDLLNDDNQKLPMTLVPWGVAGSGGGAG